MFRSDFEYAVEYMSLFHVEMTRGETFIIWLLMAIANDLSLKEKK